MCCRMFWLLLTGRYIVSVAGFLGYDVLRQFKESLTIKLVVSVAGFLGYDVLRLMLRYSAGFIPRFSSWLLRL